jgi:hypothetical protein
MSKSKHTPGPWRAQLHEDFEGQWGVVSTCEIEWLIAEAAPHIDGDPDEANARLIAAAPELLEALQALRRICADTPAVERNPRFVTANSAALAAIAKAKGETP